MKLIIDNSFTNSFISETVENNGIIRWTYKNNNLPDYIFMLQAPFNAQIDIVNIANIINNSNIDLVSDEEIKINSIFTCKLISKLQYGSGVYKTNFAPASYYFFCCKKDGDNIVLYDESSYRNNHCDVFAIIEFHQESHVETKTIRHFFKREENSFKFSKITFVENKNYIDGALYYTFDGCSHIFPISKKILGKPFYIRWYNDSVKPSFYTNINGFKVKQI